MRIQSLAFPLLALVSLGACSSAWKPPEIKYDDTPRQAVLQPDPPKPVQIVELPKPLPLPGQLKPLPGAKTAPVDPADPHARVDQANGAARVQPTRAGYINAMQVYPFSEGALYQVYAAPGQITDIALAPGEQLVGSGPVAAGDTVRWVIGDTESGTGSTKRVSRITDFEGPVVAVIEGSCGWMVRGWLVGLNFPVPVPVGCREVGKRKREVGGGLRFAFDRGGCRGQRLVRR